MTRTIDDPVFVRTRPAGGARPVLERGAEVTAIQPVSEKSRSGNRGEPEQFIWRDRLYVVRSVLGYWRERRSWWAGSAARALAGEQATTVADLAACGDREVWRVQAAAGRRATGVFELCAEGSGADRLWRLLRVED